MTDSIHDRILHRAMEREALTGVELTTNEWYQLWIEETEAARECDGEGRMDIPLIVALGLAGWALIIWCVLAVRSMT